VLYLLLSLSHPGRYLPTQGHSGRKEKD